MEATRDETTESQPKELESLQLDRETIRCVLDKILVAPIDPEKVTKTGIHLPDSAVDLPHAGWVVRTGRGRLLPTGEVVPLEILVGDLVLFEQHVGTELQGLDERLLFLREDDVIAYVRREAE